MFLDTKEYEKQKKKLFDTRMSFYERITSKRRTLKTVGGSYFLEKNGDDSELSKYELSLISILDKEVSKKIAQNNANIEPLARQLTNWCLMRGSLEKEYRNVYQIDIDSAFLTAAKNKKFISQKTFESFFQSEKSDKEILLKQNIDDYCDKSTGEILRVSKKCRLIALGRLAQNGTEHFYKYDKKAKKTVIESTTDLYNETRASVFFTSAYEVDKVLLKCLKNGGLFYWVDAVFCQEKDLEKITSIIKQHGFNFKIKEHEILIRNNYDLYVSDFSKEKFKRYSFNKKKTLELALLSQSTQKEVEERLRKLALLENKTEQEQFIELSKYLECSVNSAKRFCTKTGFSPTQYIIFNEAKEKLGISSIDEMNVNVLSYTLKKLGLNISDYIKTFNIVSEEFEFNDFDTIKKIVVFDSVIRDNKNEYKKIFEQEKAYRNEMNENYLISYDDAKEMVNMYDFF